MTSICVRPALAKTNFHRKEGVFPEDVKIINWICVSCKCSPHLRQACSCVQLVWDCLRGWKAATSGRMLLPPCSSSCPCSGLALQALGAFQWLICSSVSASWGILSSPWNAAHTSPPTHTLWFQLQMGTREEKGKIVVVRRWRSETQMKQKV